MKPIRRRLAGLVCLGLLWQAGVYTAAASVAGYAGAADRQDLPDCCKLHGPDDVCPMDAARATRRSSTAARLMDPCCSPDRALLTLLGAVGIPAGSPGSPEPARATARPRWSPSPHDSFTPIPSVPPPRR